MTESAVLHAPQQKCCSLRDELKQATRIEHDQLETDLDLMRATFTLEEYRALLTKYLGFYRAFEAYLHSGADACWPATRFYTERPRKQQWLQNDLAALGAGGCLPDHATPADDFAALFPCAFSLLGAVYVIEGSMLGGRILTRHFAETLGLSPEHGLQFFNGYGAQTKAHWQALLQLLESCDDEFTHRSQAVRGAKRMFSLLHRHLVSKPVA